MLEFWEVCVRLLDQYCFRMQIIIYRNTNLLFDYSILFINNYSHKIETWHADCNKNVTFYEGWNFNSGNYLFTTDTK